MVLAEEASRMAAASALSDRRLSNPVRRESSVSPICATRVSMSEPSAALPFAERGGERPATVVEHIRDAVDVRLDLPGAAPRRAS